MPAVSGKLEHKWAIYLHRLVVHCIYRDVFISKKKGQKLSMQLVEMPRNGKCSENARATQAILHHYSTTLTKNNQFLNN